MHIGRRAKRHQKPLVQSCSGTQRSKREKEKGFGTGCFLMIFVSVRSLCLEQLIGTANQQAANEQLFLPMNGLGVNV